MSMVEVTVMYSPAPRVVHERVMQMTIGLTVKHAI
jgi:hypothetical protein